MAGRANTTLSTPAAATGGVLIGGALAKLLLRVIKMKWPAFLDEEVADDIDILVVAGCTSIPAFVMHLINHQHDVPAPPTATQ